MRTMHRLKKALPWFLLFVLISTYVPVINPSDAAAVMQRGEDDAWIHKEGTPLKAGLRLAVALGEQTAYTQFAGSGRVGEDEHFHISRVWIVNRSDSYLAREWGRAIQKQLMQDASLWEVAYFPASDLPLKVRRPPHVYITYAIEDFHENHGPIWHRWGATVQVQMARSPFGPTPGGLGTEADPVRRLQLRYEVTQFGWTTRAVRFDRGIAQWLQHLKPLQWIQLWRGREPQGHELPLDWAGPPPEPPTDWVWLNELQPTRIASQAPAPNLEQHAWVAASPPGPDPLQTLRTAIEAAGFETSTAASNEVLTGVRGTTRITLHHPDPDEPTEVAIQAMRWPTAQELAEWTASHATDTASRDFVLQALLRQPDRVRREVRAALAQRADAASLAELIQALDRSAPAPAAD